MYGKPTILCFFILTISFFCAAQKKETRHLVGSNLVMTASYAVNESLAVKIVAYDKRNWGSFRSNMDYVDLRVEHQLKNQFKVGLGIGYFKLFLPFDLDEPIRTSQEEIRPLAYLIKTYAMNQARIHIQLLFEERFRQQLPTVREEQVNGFYHYSRLRLKGDYHQPIGQIGTMPVGVSASEEIIVKFGNNISYPFDQNRVFMGGYLVPTDQIKVHVGYEYWYLETAQLIRHLHYPTLKIVYGL